MRKSFLTKELTKKGGVMPHYYIPAQDSLFEAWFVNYLQYAAANAAALGLSPAQVLDLQTAKINWSLAFNNYNTAQ